jgi:hypothetical protein
VSKNARQVTRKCVLLCSLLVKYLSSRKARMSQSSLPDTTLNLHRRDSFRESIRLFWSRSKESLKSTKSIKPDKKQPSSYYPYSVYEQTMFPLILRDPEATNKLLEAVLESPNGKRSLSRLARTCRALSEPALNMLWKDLDSLVPIIGLFPSQLLKKAKKPGLGLVSQHRRRSSLLSR